MEKIIKTINEKISFLLAESKENEDKATKAILENKPNYSGYYLALSDSALFHVSFLRHIVNLLRNRT